MRCSSLIFEKIVKTVIRHAWFIVVLWVAIFTISIPGMLKVSKLLSVGTRVTEKIESNAVREIIQKHFTSPFISTYIVTVESSKYNVDDDVYVDIVHALKFLLEDEEDTLKVVSYYDTKESAMKSGRKTFLVVGQETTDSNEKRVPHIRNNIAKELKQLHKTDPSLKVYVTGLAAVAYDIHEAVIAGTKKVERLTLFFTLILLLIAFRSITGALIPIIIAIFSNTIGMAIIFLIAQYISIATFAQSISTMLGLAIGIDYSLLIVWRYREELAKCQNIDKALSKTIIVAGSSIFFSGFVVIIGLSGLLFTNVESLYSIGIGGITVVTVSLLLSLSLTPAILAIVGEKINYPRFLFRHLSILSPSKFWKNLASKIQQKPIRYFVPAFVLLCVLSAPAFRMDIRDSDIAAIPSSLESKKAIDHLSTMSISGVISPLQIIVKSNTDTNVLNANMISKMKTFCEQLKKDTRVAKVQTIFTFFQDHEAQKILLSDAATIKLLYPQLVENFMSENMKYTLIQVIPTQSDNYEQVASLYRYLHNQKLVLQKKEIEIFIGGNVAFAIEYCREVLKGVKQIILAIIIATYFALLFAFRSLLLPLKAIILNIFSVAVSYGLLVLVFQDGWIPGVTTSAITTYIPLLLFCIVFGLSMDYEVFLIMRIKEEYYNLKDNEKATVQGIATTGDVITYAALMMCVVFATFMLVEISLIHQLGFGLAVAIFVDATVVRMVLVPAFMKMAGKWNWYPENWK